MFRLPLAVALLAACGQGQAPMPVPGPVAVPTPAVPTPPSPPPPTLPPAVSTPTAPPASASACTLDPPGGLVVATERGRARVLVGAQGVLVAHGTRARPRYDPDNQGNWDCGWADSIAALGFPLAATPPRVVEPPWDTTAGCGVLQPDPVALVRRGDEPMAVACGNHPYSKWTCATARPFSPSAPRVALPNLVTDATGRATAFAWRDGTLFGAVVTSDGRLIGYTAQEGQPTRRALLGPARGAVTPLIDPHGPTEAAITLVSDADTATQVVMGANAERVGEPTTVPRPNPMGLAFEVAAVREPAPTHLAARATPAAPLQAIAGIDPAAATFAPGVRAFGAGHLLVWSEGLGDATRIRAARFDAARLALAGPIFEVSTAGREAGFAAVDAFGAHAVVAWDEKNGATWEVHAAELRCP